MCTTSKAAEFEKDWGQVFETVVSTKRQTWANQDRERRAWPRNPLFSLITAPSDPQPLPPTRTRAIIQVKRHEKDSAQPSGLSGGFHVRSPLPSCSPQLAASILSFPANRARRRGLHYDGQCNLHRLGQLGQSVENYADSPARHPEPHLRPLYTRTAVSPGVQRKCLRLDGKGRNQPTDEHTHRSTVLLSV